MDRYKIIKESIGEGTFGNVCQALDTQTGELVAIKRMKKKYYSQEECLNLPEVKSLRKMSKHKNIVQLKETIRENNILYCVFEYLECDLLRLMQNRANLFSEDQIRHWFFQVFQALAYMHQCGGYFHRDLKPENLLVTKDERTIKVADFGLAREISSQPPYTDYVSTRWYRAPEVLLKSSWYSVAVDMWAMGAILAESFTLSPLFPGTTEADELYKICSVIGSPNQESWAKGLQFAKSINFQFPQLPGVSDLSVLIPSASEAAVSLITLLCSWDPNKRPTAQQALQHPFFRSCYYIPPSLRSRTIVTTAKSQPLPVRMTTAITPLPEQLMTSSRKYSTDKQSQSMIYRQAPRNNPILPHPEGKNREEITDTWKNSAESQGISSRKVIVPPRQKQQATFTTAPPPQPHMKTGGWHGDTIFNGHLHRLPHGNSYVTGGGLGDRIYRY
ncbi:hypothetical protein MKW94_030709 [Papaver nudicaule]|uniref:cyclin-dependent kinase n=1 Tax=Papaver nudicaule TaxID=74823 RepID=A0AA41VB81_PAPNU|nr:hypothetical protein [Papaver nudicaule]